eukprot:TRINITY_DN1866_c0_g1_i1.p2 TRINITY_DN1866_c0_g1~~TRINITY_DN1866_c0_g1_i1.p2  ORF type:complete len:109 (+),score=8.63 TRINITY_DN1866_c0_g1_i1:157-483(+)
MASSTTGMRAFALAIFLALLVTTASARSRKNGGSSNTSGQSRNSEIKAELNNMMNNITKTHPKYVGDLKKAIQTISFARTCTGIPEVLERFASPNNTHPHTHTHDGTI